MFEFLRLSGSEERGIALETRRRNRVANAQAAEPDGRNIRVFERVRTKHPDWEIRKGPCGIYNCFGHVWAARRTAIYDQAEVETILRDDGYRKLSSSETPLQGDVALYHDPTRAEFGHVGLVCELRYLVTEGGMEFGAPVIWVLSKWNDVSGEVLHRFDDVPFPYGERNSALEYWTDRPAIGTP